MGIEECYSKILKNEGAINSTKLKNAVLKLESRELTLFKFYEQFLSDYEKKVKSGLPDFISFDHDLGLEESGYGCAKWLVNYCLDNNLRLPKFDVHSQNPVGKENILSLLKNFKKI